MEERIVEEQVYAKLWMLDGEKKLAREKREAQEKKDQSRVLYTKLETKQLWMRYGYHLHNNRITITLMVVGKLRNGS